MRIKTAAIFFSGLLLVVSDNCNGQQTVTAVADSGLQADGYHLVWADEFNAEGAPDTASWGFKKRFCP